MKADHAKHPTERMELPGILSEFRQALNDEIDEIEKSGQSSTLLFGGQRLEGHAPEYWYRFQVEYAPSIPADTPCKLIIGNNQFEVTTVSFEENYIIISSKSPLPESIGKARLENGATVLIERLIKCIEDNAATVNPAGLHMIQADGGLYNAQRVFNYHDIQHEDKNTQGQNDAIDAALSYDITYIWGPPGTGKTTVIGQIIKELYRHNHSVLAVSHTNTAVDGAIAKVADYIKPSKGSEESYPVLRLGSPVRPLPDRVLLTSHVNAAGKKLYERKRYLEQQKAALIKKENDLQLLLAKAAWAEHNHLDEIQPYFDMIAELQEKIYANSREIQNLTAVVDRYNAANPEYAKFSVLTENYQAVLAEYKQACAQVSQNEAQIKELQSRCQEAEIELRKFNVYDELNARAEKLMPAAFLEREILKAKNRISAENEEYASLKQKRSAAFNTLVDYEAKGKVGKFFFNKSALATAKNDMREIDDRLSRLEDAVNHDRTLEQEYQRQLKDVQLLQHQIQDVSPSHTYSYWQRAYSAAKSKLDNCRQTHPKLCGKRNTIQKQLRSIEPELNRAKKARESIERELQQLASAKEYHQQAYAIMEQRKRFCAEQLEKECQGCASFYSPSGESDRSLLDELKGLLKKVRAELASKDIKNIPREKARIEKQLIEINTELIRLEQQMQELQTQVIMRADIIGTTLTKTYLNDVLRSRQFDAVILDEASMASIPALWCAAWLAKKSIIIVGDFLQLPPIVLAQTEAAKKWLGRDVFYHSGVQAQAKSGKHLKNFIMLREQFRMERDIADIANIYYGDYGGLRSHDSKSYRKAELEAFYSWYPDGNSQQNIHLIDTESLHAWATGVPQGKSHSRVNCFSAAIDVDLAFHLLEKKISEIHPKAKPAENASILIVAPYRPHVARINQLIGYEYSRRGYKDDLNLIRAGTIHSFQGSEADIVIFDLVVDEPHWKANLFMPDETINEGLRKMFNVAVTRARFKLYIVGNLSFCQKRAKNNALGELLDVLLSQKALPKEDAKALFPNLTVSKTASTTFAYRSHTVICREQAFNECFMRDIQSFQHRLIIYSPFMTEARLSALLPIFSDATRAGKQIIIVTKSLKDRNKKELFQYEKCEKALRNLGVSVIHKSGMHEKLIFIDSDALWIGSLNALSFTGLTGEVMQRLTGKEITAEYEKIFDIAHICHAVENACEQKCPICGGELQLKEGNQGGVYWECINQDYTRNPNQQYPTDGILRCQKCGAPFLFSMNHEPRWVCSSNPRHFQKMKEGDLKLEKMAAMIQRAADRKRVAAYFAQKKTNKDT